MNTRQYENATFFLLLSYTSEYIQSDSPRTSQPFFLFYYEFIQIQSFRILKRTSKPYFAILRFFVLLKEYPVAIKTFILK